jgi:hypothetical protein
MSFVESESLSLSCLSWKGHRVFLLFPFIPFLFVFFFLCSSLTIRGSLWRDRKWKTLRQKRRKKEKRDESFYLHLHSSYSLSFLVSCHPSFICRLLWIVSLLLFPSSKNTKDMWQIESPCKGKIFTWRWWSRSSLEEIEDVYEKNYYETEE